MDLSVSLRQAGDATIVDLTGDLVSPECRSLHGEIKQLLQSGARQLAVNLKNVQRIDEHGLGTLSSCHVSVLREFSTLSLLSPTPEVRGALQGTHLERVLEIYDTEEELLARLHKRATDPARTEGLYLVAQARQVMCVALWGFLGLVLVVLWMQLSHPGMLRRLTWLVQLERFLLGPIHAFSHDAAAVFFYLLSLLFVGGVLLIIFDSRLHRLRSLIEGRNR
jgi:anti-anti-sigma factor